MAKVGDKFIIEIESVMTNKNGTLYSIKGLYPLCISEERLNNLENYDEKRDGIQRMNDAEREYHYQKGLKGAWEAATKIVLEGGKNDLSPEELEEIFKTRSLPGIFANYSAAEAISKIKAYEEQKKAEGEIRINDEIYSSVSNTRAVVTAIDDTERIWRCLSNYGFFTVTDFAKKLWVKTGRQFDIDGILKAMMEG